MRYHIQMKARDLLKIMKGHGCVEVRRNATHIVVKSPCGKCTTTVVDHKGEDIAKGTLRKNVRDMEPCLGKGWLNG